MIVAAYKDRAIQACQKDAMTASLGLAPQAWGNASSVKLVIGKGNLNVQFWQVDSELWGARYRNPFLILGASARSGQLYCEYDIVNVSAPVHAM